MSTPENLSCTAVVPSVDTDFNRTVWRNEASVSLDENPGRKYTVAKVASSAERKACSLAVTSQVKCSPWPNKSVASR